VFGGLPQAESKVTVTNGSRGASVITLDVNGTAFRLTGMADGETRTVDVAAAMTAGSANVISATLLGAPGASAMLMIADS
jgi:hypothetical protein